MGLVLPVQPRDPHQPRVLPSPWNRRLSSQRIKSLPEQTSARRACTAATILDNMTAACLKPGRRVPAEPVDHRGTDLSALWTVAIRPGMTVRP